MLIPAILAAFVAKITHAELIQYMDHLVMPDRPEYLVIPKFDKREVPHWYPGHGRSFIDMSDLRISSSCDPEEMGKRPPPPPGSEGTCIDVDFDILMFRDPGDKPWTDYWTDGNYCCTDEVVEAGGCSTRNLNKLIVPPTLPGAFLRSVSVPAYGEANENTGLSKDDITKSGIYVLIMAMCNPESLPVSVSGSIESIEPYGYVPADEFGSMPFNLTLSLMYLVISLAWGVLCFAHSDQLMPLQFWITGMMVVALIETTMLYFHYIDWNDHGIPTTAITIIALFFGALKRAVSRILIMLVCLGYGVVRPSLGEEMHRVLYLGGSYFVLSFVYTLIMNLSPSTRMVSESDYDVVSLLVFLLALVDTTFYVWIFTSINNLMTSLAARKQGVKYLLYRQFRTVLIVLLFFTCAWVIYSSALFLNDSGGANVNWRMKWTIDALWELIYFTIFVAIAVLWAPSNNAQRYAYSIELSQLDNDEEFQGGEEAAGGGNSEDNDGDLDSEYGGKLQDEKDPFQGTGALDPSMAALKKA